jgi:hypothetical protein
MKRFILFLFLISPFLSFGQDTLNAMFYNLYRFPTSPPANREYLLRSIVDAARPDLLMACELVNEQGADHVVNISFGDMPDSFARATFVNSPDSADPLQQMVFYNTRKLILVRQEALLTYVRHINHYTFVLHTPDVATDSVFLDVFVTHLKSSTGAGNEHLRLEMVDTFVKALTHIPSDHHVLFAGDFNFYTSEEPGYQKILDSSNAVRMVDPINRPGHWNNNPEFSDIHSQATRITAAGFGIGGASGGMDDRFDFIMMSENSRTDPQCHYIPGSYKVFGNNGDCFNKRIDDLNSYGPYSLSIRQILYNMSDHAPVIMKFKTDKRFVTAIKEKSKPPALLQFPEGNLAYQYLNVKLSRGIKDDHLLIYNISGKLLKSIPLHPQTRDLHIDVSAFAIGWYFLKLGRQRDPAMGFIKR